jgi:hypothetical protein
MTGSAGIAGTRARSDCGPTIGVDVATSGRGSEGPHARRDLNLTRSSARNVAVGTSSLLSALTGKLRSDSVDHAHKRAKQNGETNNLSGLEGSGWH